MRIYTKAVIEGMTAFPDSDAALVTAGLTGQPVSDGTVENAKQKLLALYRAKGFLYTTVRATVAGTELRFTVTEGYVAEVKLDGEIGPAATQVLRFLNHLVGKKPLSVPDLERWLLLSQDIPGLTVRTVLNPSSTDPGALTLVAQVSRKWFSGLAMADNRAFYLAGPEEALAVLNFDSFTEYGERTQLSLFRTFGGTSAFGQAMEEFYLGGSGLKFRMYGGAGVVTPSGQLAQTGYDGNTRTVGVQLSYPLIRARAEQINLFAGFDGLENDVYNNLGANGNKTRTSYDSLRVVRLGGEYASRDTLLEGLLGPGHEGLNGFSARYSQGLEILGASKNGDTTTPPPRLGEKINFSKVSGELSRTQRLFVPYDDGSVSFRTALAWQYTTDLLPPTQKFYLGGPTFNRGYYFGQLSGDQGVSFAAELRLDTPVPSPVRLPFEMKAQYYGFYDWGKVWQQTSKEADVAVQSAGIGVRLFVTEATEIDLEGVYRLNRYPGGQGPGISALNTAAFYWQILQRF